MILKFMPTSQRVFENVMRGTQVAFKAYRPLVVMGTPFTTIIWIFVYITSVVEMLSTEGCLCCRYAGAALRGLAGDVRSCSHPPPVEIPGQRSLAGREHPPSPGLPARTF